MRWLVYPGFMNCVLLYLLCSQAMQWPASHRRVNLEFQSTEVWNLGKSLCQLTLILEHQPNSCLESLWQHEDDPCIFSGGKARMLNQHSLLCEDTRPFKYPARQQFVCSESWQVLGAEPGHRGRESIKQPGLPPAKGCWQTIILKFFTVASLQST